MGVTQRSRVLKALQEAEALGKPYTKNQLANTLGMSMPEFNNVFFSLRAEGRLHFLTHIVLFRDKFKKKGGLSIPIGVAGKVRKCLRLECRAEFFSEGGIFFLCPTHRAHTSDDNHSYSTIVRVPW